MVLVEIRTNTSVFYMIPHKSWTAFEDTFGTIQEFKKEALQMNISTCVLK